MQQRKLGCICSNLNILAIIDDFMTIGDSACNIYKMLKTIKASFESFLWDERKAMKS